MANDDSGDILIADIGATTSRCALLDDGVPGRIRYYHNNEAESLPAMLQNYLHDVQAKPRRCALAVAAPIDGDEVVMSNRDWSFSVASLKATGFDDVDVINDFHAVGYALPYFDDASREEVGQATQYREGNIAVLGPGSGLGMAAWINGVGVMAGEGGHITLAGHDRAEDEIIARLREEYGHCSAERVLSGPGLAALHHALHGVRVAAPEDITEQPDEAANKETLAQFFRFLGSAAADLALITGAYGGVYIAGGIVPAAREQLHDSDFRSRFEDMGRYRDYMRAIPTWVITDPLPGLTGLAAYVKYLAA